MTATQWRLSMHNSRIEVIDALYNPVCKMSLRKDDRDLAERIIRDHNTHDRAIKSLKYARRILLTESENYRDGDEYQPRGKSLLKEAEIIQTTLTDMEG